MSTVKVLSGPLGYAVAALIGIGAVYWIISKLAHAGSDATKPLAIALGDWYANATLPDPISLSGGVVLPGGAIIALDDIQNNGTGFGPGLTFQWGGVAYKLDHREGNNYIAVRK